MAAEVSAVPQEGSHLGIILESLVRIRSIQPLLPTATPAIHPESFHHPLELRAAHLTQDAMDGVAYSDVRFYSLACNATD